jgi:hypothetical protein
MYSLTSLQTTQQLSRDVFMEQNDRESTNQNTGSDQTSFGGELNSGFAGETAGTSGSDRFEAGSGSSSFSGAPASTESSSQSRTTIVTDKVKSVASSVKGKASNLPAMLADGLQAGADALRQRRSAIAGIDGSSTATADNSGIVAVTDSIATGMQSSAEWLRDADLDKIKDGVEKQVKEHPARTLLIALGAGYVLGKAFRR